jgi:hypothetical protein
VSLLSSLGGWYVKRRLKKIFRRIRKEVDPMDFIGKLIGLDFDFLKGFRTKLGLVGMFAQPIIDTFADGAVCARFPGTCAVVQGFSKWLIIAGIYGKK